MKKMLFMFLLFISTPVFAQQYTEYAFVGYEQERPEVDEFTKYEEVRIHKYYNLKEGAQELVDKYDSKKENFSHCKSEPILNKVFSSEESPNYKNEKFVLIKSPAKYKVNEVKIENIDLETLIIEKVEILIKNELIYTIKKENLDDQIFTYNLPNVDIDDIEVLVYYESKNFAKIIFSLLGDAKVSSIVNVEGGYDHSSFRALSPDKHAEFIGAYGFENQKFLHYYGFIEEKYICNNVEKEYYKDSIENSLDGYIYDSDEDVIQYKVYKREKLDIPTVPDNLDKTETQNSTEKDLDLKQKPITQIVSNANTTELSQKNSSIESTDDFEPTYNVDINSDRIAYGKSDDILTETKTHSSTLEDDKWKKYEADIKLLKRLLLVILILMIIQTIHSLCVNKSD